MTRGDLGEDLPAGYKQWIIGLLVTVIAVSSILSLVEGNRGRGPLYWKIFAFFSVCSVGVGYYIYLDSNELLRHSGWPRYRMMGYILPGFIPGVNLVVAPLYILNRRWVERTGQPLIRLGVLRRAARAPSRTARTIYRGVGLFFTLLVLLSFSLSYPVSFVLSEEHVVSRFFATFVGIVLLLVLYHRLYTHKQRRVEIDILLRDLSVRVATIPGLAMTILVVVLVLIVPIFIVTAPLYFANQYLYLAGARAALYAPFVLALAVAFTLPLRLLPWINAIPFIARDVGAKIRAQLERHLPMIAKRDVTNDGPSIIPNQGYPHTNLQFDFDVELAGYYGYIPTPISEMQLQDVPSSRKWGVLLFLPSYLFTVTIFTFVQLRPQFAVELASILPAENIIAAGGSFVGIPRLLIKQAIALSGLPPEMVSLGFVGLVVPAVLMIPAAWHIALEYERLQYRLLQRLEGNHHLLLWILPVIMPLVLVYLRISDWRSSSPQQDGTPG